MSAAAKVAERVATRREATSPLDWSHLRELGIRRLTSDSRSVSAGDTFVAYPGESRDGRDYIADALKRGAGSVLWERRGFTWRAGWDVPNAGVEHLRRHAGEIASDLYGQPSARLWMVGVTGTNGKTSCSQWIAQSLTRLGSRCGVIGTLGSGWPGRLEPIGNTTPDALWLQERLREFGSARARAVAMEVSSHGLAQDRVAGVAFDVALFTNLTRDHLDYHGTMRAYRNAKARLFRMPGLTWAVVNLDDAFGAELAGIALERNVQVLGYGFNRTLPIALKGRRIPRLHAHDLQIDENGIVCEVSTPQGHATLRSPLVGRFNAANLLGVLGVLLASGHPLSAAVDALAHVRPVPGRTERYGGGRKPLVIVDYAHTPDALENVLRAMRELMNVRSAVPGERRGLDGARRAPKLVCVFGCGGDRDRGKRPLMGRIATRLADEVIVTSDNPRTEDPHTIITDIIEGMTARPAIAPDRSQAIRAAIAGAHAGDLVVIAGKGHEQYQEIDGVRHPYSDAAVVKAALMESAR